jgi:hypothetical protein
VIDIKNDTAFSHPAEKHSSLKVTMQASEIAAIGKVSILCKSSFQYGEKMCLIWKYLHIIMAIQEITQQLRARSRHANDEYDVSAHSACRCQVT